MLELSTAFAVLTIVAGAFFVWQCHGYAADARDALRELKKSQGVIHSHTLTLDALHGHLRRLNGKVASMQPARRAPLDDDDPAQINLGADVDPAFAAELALQNAPAVAPGKG